MLKRKNQLYTLPRRYKTGVLQSAAPSSCFYSAIIPVLIQMHAVKRFAKWGGIVHVRVERIPVSEAVIKLLYASAIGIIENKSEHSALPLCYLFVSYSDNERKGSF